MPPNPEKTNPKSNILNIVSNDQIAFLNYDEGDNDYVVNDDDDDK